MKQRIIVTSEQLRDRAVAVCGMIPTDKPHIVDIREHRETRTDKQHRYYRQMVGDIANFFGNMREEQHQIYKRMFLVDIFRTHRPEYEYLYTVATTAPGADVERVHAQIARVTSTTETDVQMMREYIDQVYHHALSFDVRFPVFERYR